MWVSKHDRYAKALCLDFLNELINEFSDWTLNATAAWLVSRLHGNSAG